MSSNPGSTHQLGGSQSHLLYSNPNLLGMSTSQPGYYPAYGGGYPGGAGQFPYTTTAGAGYQGLNMVGNPQFQAQQQMFNQQMMNQQMQQQGQQQQYQPNHQQQLQQNSQFQQNLGPYQAPTNPSSQPYQPQPYPAQRGPGYNNPFAGTHTPPQSLPSTRFEALESMPSSIKHKDLLENTHARALERSPSVTSGRD